MSDNKNSHKLVTTLTYAGTVPLIAWPIGLLLSRPASEFWNQPLLNYVLVIISFMAGTVWDATRNLTSVTPRQKNCLLMLSVTLALLPWLLNSVLRPDQDIFVSVILFLTLLIVDNWRWRLGLLPSWYIALRFRVTAIVCVCLGLTLWIGP
jgi:hypothetical protein